jgi:hypothetical protein
MAKWDKNNFRLIAQGITGGRVWWYEDTGLYSNVVDTAGFFQKAGDMGADTGDFIYVQARGGAAGTNSNDVYGTAMNATQDTGSSQGTTGPGTLIGDTG